MKNLSWPPEQINFSFKFHETDHSERKKKFNSSDTLLVHAPIDTQLTQLLQYLLFALK